MKERIARIFVFLLGVGWILGTVAFKKLGFSENTFTDLDSLAFYGPGTISGISHGVAMILVAIFSRAISFYVAIWSLVGGVTLLAADNALYFLSPHLPYALLRHMSSEAQGKYLYSNPDPSLAKLANDGKVSFGRPGVVRESKGFRWIYDELGYPNPPGYLKSSSGADVLILGIHILNLAPSRTICANSLRLSRSMRRPFREVAHLVGAYTSSIISKVVWYLNLPRLLF